MREWEPLPAAAPMQCKTCGRMVEFRGEDHSTLDVTTMMHSRRQFIIVRCLVSALPVEQAVSQLLEALGYNYNAEALRGTPGRVAAFYKNFANPQPFEFTTFTNDGSDEMIVQRNIPFYSLCEHHLLPFFGTAAVGYIPSRRVVGLSKLARCVQHCASGLMNQEKITKAIANQIETALHPMGVGVVLRARHMCMEMRGVRAPGTETVTSCLTGDMKNGITRSEFLELARAQ